MPEPGPKADDRRRNPRFSCGGRAIVHCLPFDGISIAGVLRDLSLGGICLAAAQPMESGARTEVIVSVNATSFRAAALVSGQRRGRGTCLQFMEMSARGQSMLAELLGRLASLQALNRRLRSSQIDEETKRVLLERERLPALRVPAGENFETRVGSQLVEPNTPVEPTPLIIRVDLFA